MPDMPAGLPTSCTEYIQMINKLQNCAVIPKETRDALGQAITTLQQMFKTTPPASLLTICQTMNKSSKDLLKLCP
jgi:hypothetical protein